MILNIFGVDIRNSFLMENTDMEYSVTLFNAYISEIGNYSHYGWKQITTFCT